MDIELVKKFGYRVAPGTVMFKQGDHATKMFFVLAGEVDILLKVGKAQRLVATMGPGAIFGEMAVIDEKPRSATAIAKTEVKCLALDRGQLEQLIQRDPSFAIRVIRHMSAKLRDANFTIAELSGKDRRRILAEAMFEEAKAAGKKGFKGWRLHLEGFLNQADNFLGLDREEAKRTIHDLIKEGYIAWGAGGHEEIVLLDKLEQLK